ncbi:MAG: hypothetical protein JWL77_3280 [Chthonomonadaceae bacterium]|nr:hypothetical protein [Chthonomonadaceae bacterium]
MRKQGSKRVVLLAGGILVLLGVGLAMAMRREIRQQGRNRALITAIKAADAQSVRGLLDRGAVPDAFETPQQQVSLWGFLRDRLRGQNGAHAGTPALALAVNGAHSPYADKAGKARCISIVKALLEHDAHIDVKDEQGISMINLAVEPYHDSQILRLLLKHLGNVVHYSTTGHLPILDLKNPINGRTALLTSAGWGTPEQIELLLSAGAKVDLPDGQGQTALMYAVEKGRPENIACLLKYHATVLLKDRAGNTALSLARTNRAGNVVTPFNHEVEADFWPNIVKMLEHALPSQHVALSAPAVRHSPDLLAIATKIAGTEGWELPNGTDAQTYMTYFWISNDQLLYFMSDAHIEELLWQLDVKTGKKTSFRTVSKMWSDDGWFKKDIAISPDGQWILWDGDHSDHSYHGYYGARRDGSAKFHIPYKGFPYVTGFKWMPDSRHFVEDTGRYDAKVTHFTPLTTVMRSVDAPQIAADVSRKAADIYSGWSTRILSANRAIQIEELPAGKWPPRKYVLEETTLEPIPTLLHRWTISVPPKEEWEEMKISPDGQRIAWIVITPPDSEKPQRVALSVSRLDGSAMQEIGHLTLPASAADWFGPTFERYPSEMKWLPDGKHLSFLYKKTLYVLPVP